MHVCTNNLKLTCLLIIMLNIYIEQDLPDTQHINISPLTNSSYQWPHWVFHNPAIQLLNTFNIKLQKFNLLLCGVYSESV